MEPKPVSPTPSNSGTLVVGLLAVTALGLGIYLYLTRASSPLAAGDQTGVADHVTKLESRVVDLERRIATLEPSRAASSPASAGRAAAPAAFLGDAKVSESDAASTRVSPGPLPATARGPFSVVPNPELKGRLGRIIIAYPADTLVKDSRTDIYRAGSSSKVKTEFGDVAAELIPASYDVAISGHKLAGVVVESRSDTRVSVGVLRLHGAKDTRFEILESETQTKIHTVFGDADIGLPAGLYVVSVNGQAETVTVKDGTVTEF